MNQQDVSYALAKKVPDMHQRGFRIETAYGEIDVYPGPVADMFAQLMALHLRQAQIDMQMEQELAG